MDIEAHGREGGPLGSRSLVQPHGRHSIVSFSVDVNILLYASDTASEYNNRAAEFLRDAAEGDEVCYLSWPALMSYLRIATHPTIFASPLTPSDARANVDSLLARPHVRCVSEDQRFWSAYKEISTQITVRGNLVPDAHLAAILRIHGIRTLYTHDRDFARFDFLRIIDPLAA